jgi:hypothetical protein
MIGFLEQIFDIDEKKIVLLLKIRGRMFPYIVFPQSEGE